jgi:hypothetical protein
MRRQYGTLSRRNAGGVFVLGAVFMGMWIGTANRRSPAHDVIYVTLGLAAILVVLAPLAFLTMRSQGSGQIVWSRLPIFYGALTLWTVACALIGLITWYA